MPADDMQDRQGSTSSKRVKLAHTNELCGRLNAALRIAQEDTSASVSEDT